MKVTSQDICRLVAVQLGVRKVTPEQHLREDLGAESVGVQNLALAIEEKFGLRLSDEDLEQFQRVSDIHSLLVGQLG